MRRFEGLSYVPSSPGRGSVVTWGVFDGVHRGHQQILRDTIARARELTCDAVVVTFDRHPRTVLTGVSTPLLTSLPHRLALLERTGVDAAVVLTFDRAFALLSAEEFVRRVLVEGIGAKGVVAGYNTAFGRNREGTRTLLEALGTRFGYTVFGSSPVHHPASWPGQRGQPISSTRVRDAITGGRLAEAAEMLGRPVTIVAPVVRGAGRGRTLGFPTANLDLGGITCPPVGVYAATGRASLLVGRTGGLAEFPALVNVGRRPTFEGPEANECVEVHLVGYSGDLYGGSLEVEFHRKIRDERAFSSAQELSRQIALDKEALLADQQAGLARLGQGGGADSLVCLTGSPEGR